MEPFFDNAEDTLRDILSPWQDKYPLAYLMFNSEDGKIRFYFTDLDTSRETPKSKWFSEDEVWHLEVELSEVNAEAERVLKVLYPERNFRLVKGCQAP